MRNPGRFSPPQLRGFVLALGLAGCSRGPLEANGVPGRTVSIEAGRELELTLQTIGPGEYVSPPRVSSPAVRYLDVRQGTPGPAGATQLFRFEAVAPGVAVVVFQHKLQGPTIEDTINVR